MYINWCYGFICTSLRNTHAVGKKIILMDSHVSGFPLEEIYAEPMKTFVSVDAWVQMGKNLVSHHPVLYDKPHKWLPQEVRDNTQVEIVQQLGYNDANVVDIHQKTLFKKEILGSSGNSLAKSDREAYLIWISAYSWDRAENDTADTPHWT